MNEDQRQSLRGTLRKNCPLSELTSWQIGGPAKVVYQPADIDDLAYFLTVLSPDEKILWLGGGTNVLIRDGGYPGIVIALRDVLDQCFIDEKDLTVTAESGLLVAKLSKACADLGLSHLEFLSGIPGSVGGALAMNAGAYGQQIWDYVLEVEVIDRLGKRYKRDPSDYKIAYRFVELPTEEWFISVKFKLKQGDKQEILNNISQMLERRRQSQPLDLPSAGSVFRNPSNDYAARLIEKAGLKGCCIGGAKVSKKHANFIVNEGRATAKDVEALIDHVAKTVKKLCGVQLIPEVKIIGETL